jgi:hypothetical protein
VPLSCIWYFRADTPWPIVLLHYSNPFGHNMISSILLILTNGDSEMVCERTKAARSVQNRHISLKDVSELSVHKIRLIQELMVFFDLPIFTLCRFFFLSLSVAPHEEPSHQYEIQRDQHIQDDNADLGWQVSWSVLTLESLRTDDIADGVRDCADYTDCDFLR